MAKFGRFGTGDVDRGRDFRKRVDAVNPNADGEYLLSEIYPSATKGRFDSLREKLFPLTVKNKPSTAFSFPLGDSPEDGWGSSTSDPEDTVAYLRRDKTPISNKVYNPGAAGEYNPRTGGIAVRSTGAQFDNTLRHEMIHKALDGAILPGQPGGNFDVRLFGDSGEQSGYAGSRRLNELTNKMAKIWVPGEYYRGNPLQEVPAHASLGDTPGFARDTDSDNLFSPAETKEYQKELDNYYRSRGTPEIADELSRLRKGSETMRSILPGDAYGMTPRSLREHRIQKPGPVLELPEKESLVDMLRRTITPKRSK